MFLYHSESIQSVRFEASPRSDKTTEKFGKSRIYQRFVVIKQNVTIEVEELTVNVKREKITL